MTSRPVRISIAFSLLLSAAAHAESRLRSVWQEYQAAAGVANGTTWGAASDEHSGSGSVPGKRDMHAKAVTPPGGTGEFTTAEAETTQRCELRPAGFWVAGSTRTLQSGVFPDTLVQSALIIEVEISQPEIFLLNVTDYESAAEDGGGLSVFRKTSGTEWVNAGGCAFRERVWEVEYQPGIYRFELRSSIQDTSHQPRQRGESYTYEVSFSNYVIETGALQSHPHLPDINRSFTSVASGRWFDPPLADGFSFEAEGDTLFKEIRSMPNGFGDNFHVYVGGVKLAEVQGGESYSFVSDLGNAVSAFEIRNIVPLVDGSSPTAFPVMLTFVQELGGFSMNPIEATFANLIARTNGDIEIQYQGLLQSSDSPSNPFVDFDPQPPSPFVIPKASLKPQEFFRARKH